MMPAVWTACAAVLLAVVLLVCGSIVDDLRHPSILDRAPDRAAGVALLVAGVALALVLVAQLVTVARLR